MTAGPAEPLPPVQDPSPPPHGPSQEIFFAAMGLGALMMVLGVLTQAPPLALLGGLILFVAFVVTAIFGKQFDPGVRALFGGLAGALVVVGLYAYFLWWQELMRASSTYGGTCGAFLALPAMGLLAFLFVARPLVFARLGLRPPA